MNETMKKTKFTELIRSTRLEFDSLLEKFTPAQMTQARAALAQAEMGGQRGVRIHSP